MIVLNGEPFVLYNLRALYPYAHEIIVVEGAAPAAKNIATDAGHSRDTTLETLRIFKEQEDVDDKLVIVTAEDQGYTDGFWPGEKDEQSRAYAERTTGDYLWQVDVDEFYQPHDMETILDLLSTRPEIDAISFQQLMFWGALDYITDSWYLKRGGGIFHRLFRWSRGYEYVTHRPPTVHNEQGINLREKNLVDGKTLAKQGIYLYHYSFLFPQQVLDKSEYYSEAD